MGLGGMPGHQPWVSHVDGNAYIYGHSLKLRLRLCAIRRYTTRPNLQHAIERVERPGGSHEGVERKKSVRSVATV